MQGKEDVGGRYSKQKMVMGTHTSEGEQNYLMLAEVGPLPVVAPHSFWAQQGTCFRRLGRRHVLLASGFQQLCCGAKQEKKTEEKYPLRWVNSLKGRRHRSLTPRSRRATVSAQRRPIRMRRLLPDRLGVFPGLGTSQRAES